MRPLIDDASQFGVLPMMLSERHEKLLKRTFLDYQQTSEFLKAPLVVDRAEGLYYWDLQGKRYFDAIGGIFVAVLGHRHPRVVEAAQRQMEKLTFAPPLHGVADVTLDFVEKLGSIAPGSLELVKALSGGSESTETAMKFARQYFKQTGHPGKYKFISCYTGYHGGTFAAMSASGTGRRKTKFEPQMAGFLKVFFPLHYRDRFDTPQEANRFAARAFEDVIVAEDPATVAGIMIEPISNTGGIVTPTDEFFQILRQTCDRHNVLLIYDEIITGLARTGRMFAAETLGTTPDILCSGKALSSGMIPMGSMIALANEVHKKNGYLMITDKSIYCEQDRNVGFTHPFGLHIPIKLNPWLLSIALVEMCQYPVIRLLREVPPDVKPEELQTPLVVGTDWGSCAVMVPERGHYDYG